MVALTLASSPTNRLKSGLRRIASCRRGSSLRIMAASPAPTIFSTSGHCSRSVAISRPPQAMALQAEALFSNSIEQREYTKQKSLIPIVTDEAGHSHIEVTIHQFRDPLMRRMLWQAREGASIQNFGRPGWAA